MSVIIILLAASISIALLFSCGFIPSVKKGSMMMKKALLLECFLMTNPNTATKVRDQMRNSANVQECDQAKPV